MGQSETMNNKSETKIKRVAFITNIPSPYRVGQFINLQNKILEYEFFFIFSDTGNKERAWNVNLEGLRNAIFLNSKPLIIKKEIGDKRILSFFKCIQELEFYIARCSNCM